MTAYGTDLALTRRAIEAALRNAARNVPQPTMRPGSVAVSTSAPHDTVSVIVDGDTIPTVMGNTSGLLLAAGDRVMVTFQPPSAVFCTGVIGASISPSENVLDATIASAQTTSGSTVLTIGTIEVPAQPFPCKLLGSAFISGSPSVAGDEFILRLNVDGVEKARIYHRHYAINGRAGYSIPPSVLDTIAAGVDVDVTATLTRTIGTGTLNVYSPGRMTVDIRHT